MKNRYKLWMIMILAAGLAFLVLYHPKKIRMDVLKDYEYSDQYVRLTELPALLDFYYFSKTEWEEKLTQAKLPDIVTPGTVTWILEQTGSAGYITYHPKEERTVTREQWNAVYEKMLDLLDVDNQVQIIEDAILEADSGTLTTASGSFTYDLDGLDVESMTAMGFYAKGDRIIGVRSLKSKQAVLENIYVRASDEHGLDFLIQGGQYTVDIALEDPKKVEGRVCDLLWENGQVVKVQVKEDTIAGDLIAVNDTTIEIEGYGEIERSKKLPVYKKYGTVEEKELSDIVIANMKVEYVVAKERVEAILLVEPAQISRIRVLLLADDGGAYRDQICIGANSAYRLEMSGGITEQPAEAIVAASDLFAAEAGNVIRIAPLEETGELFLCDASGSRISKGYFGSLELRRYEEGFAVVNELAVEQYLCAVVPSEMPASYELEALKVQAICARSYAYIQLGQGDYAAFGAHVDDTTNYQVYNKQDRDEKTTAAVLDTAGMVISYQGETAEAYYFSTSSGVTGNGEAWNLTADPKYGYLRNGLVKEGGGDIDLSSEESFAQFIAAPDASCYERAMPFFRWNAIGDYQSKETQEAMQGMLSARKERTPQDILFMDLQGQEVPNMQGFGALKHMGITKRSVSGVALQLRMDYEQGAVLVGNEYNIRMLLGAGLTDLTLADGSKRDGSLLPSAYTTLTLLENGTYAMSGGGYGHGIGMSQNGAGEMAKQGKTCEEILQFFFQGIEIVHLP